MNYYQQSALFCLGIVCFWLLMAELVKLHYRYIDKQNKRKREEIKVKYRAKRPSEAEMN